jgi:hypothetical protein
VNHGLIPAGNYKLKVTAKDGSGKDTSFLHEANVKIEGGECFAQSAGDINAKIEESEKIIYGVLAKARRGDTLKAKIEESWHGGYISFNAVLLDGERELANGVEQVLLRNRESFRAEVGGLNGCVWQWPAAQKALSEASCNPVEFNAQSHKSDFIVAGAVPEDGVLDSMLKKVEDDGCVLLLKFDKDWAAALRKRAILSKDVTEWGGMQTPHWMGNGWGYLEHFVGVNALPGKTVIGTTSWEVPSDPVGFYPLESGRKVNAYGVYVARPWTAKAPPAGKVDEVYDLQAHMPTMLALLATIEYGKGRIILAPSYPVDEENAFNDLLFYNILSMGCAGKW